MNTLNIYKVLQFNYIHKRNVYILICKSEINIIIIHHCQLMDVHCWIEVFCKVFHLSQSSTACIQRPPATLSMLFVHLIRGSSNAMLTGARHWDLNVHQLFELCHPLPIPLYDPLGDVGYFSSSTYLISYLITQRGSKQSSLHRPLTNFEPSYEVRS